MLLRAHSLVYNTSHINFSSYPTSHFNISLLLPFFKSAAGQRSHFYQESALRHELPIALKQRAFKIKFKKELGRFLMD